MIFILISHKVQLTSLNYFHLSAHGQRPLVNLRVTAPDTSSWRWTYYVRCFATPKSKNLEFSRVPTELIFFHVNSRPAFATVLAVLLCPVIVILRRDSIQMSTSIHGCPPVHALNKTHCTSPANHGRTCSIAVQSTSEFIFFRRVDDNVSFHHFYLCSIIIQPVRDDIQRA